MHRPFLILLALLSFAWIAHLSLPAQAATLTPNPGNPSTISATHSTTEQHLSISLAAASASHHSATRTPRRLLDTPSLSLTPGPSLATISHARFLYGPSLLRPPTSLFNPPMLN